MLPCQKMMKHFDFGTKWKDFELYDVQKLITISPYETYIINGKRLHFKLQRIIQLAQHVGSGI